MKILFAFIAVLLSLQGLCAQEPGATKWTTLASKKGDFSVAIPSDLIAYKDNDASEMRFYAGTHGSSFILTFSNTSDAKTRLYKMRGRNKDETGINRYKIEDFEIDIRTIDKSLHTVSMYLASQKGFYSLVIKSRNAEDVDLATCLRSILVNGRPMIKRGEGAVPRSETSLVADSIETSDVVRLALNHKQSRKIEIDSAAEDLTPKDEVFFSHPAVLLNRPIPGLPNVLADRRIARFVKVSVLLRGDGDIGKITVLSGLIDEYAKAAIEAAKKIKFVPAEIDGKPVDHEEIVEYSFTSL
jgi:hypothetical protein